MRRPAAFFGVLLILVGLLLLATTLGLLPPLTWSVVGPLLLIALGLWAILAATGRRGIAPAEAVAVPLEAARAGRVVVRHGAGRLDIRGGAAPGMLVDGSAAGGAMHRETRSSDSVTTTLEPPDWTAWPGGGLDWDLRLTGAVPLALELYVGASENTLDLTDLRVTDFVLETGASSTSVRLPASGVMRARVQSGAASVRIEVPPTVAARIRASGGLANIRVAGRYVRNGDVWESPGFGTAPDRVELTAELGVGELRVD